MVPALPTIIRLGGALVLILGLLVQLPSRVDAQALDGMFITVPNPIKDDAIAQIRGKIDRAILHHGRPIGAIVFDFNPSGLPSGTSDFNPCDSLADLIRDLQARTNPLYPPIKTIAFLSNEVTRHTVLPVLACNQLIWSNAVDPPTGQPLVRLGNIARDLNRPLRDKEIAAYQSVTKGKPWQELVQAMLEQRPGKTFLDLDQARKVGLCQETYNTWPEIQAALNLPPRALAEDWLVGQTPLACRVVVAGPLDAGKIESIKDRITKAVGEKANLIILELRAEGGETRQVASFARWIRELKDDSGTRPIKTVAYVPARVALGAASFLALAATEIVMAPDAVLADFTYLKDEPADQLKARRTMLGDLARQQGYPELLFEAALDPDLILQRVKVKNNPAVARLLRFDPRAKGPDPHWENHGLIERGADSFLRITAPLAQEWRVALSTTMDTDAKLYEYYGLEPNRVKLIGDSWLDRVAEFFREPTVRFILIMLGIVGLILEFKLPGTTIPGVLAAICFVLFFWASSFVGEFTLLAALLFILGLVLIGLEIFVMPGTAFPAIAGILLLLISLVLVTLRQIPQTTMDWVNLGSMVGTYAMSLVAAMAIVFAIAYFLPNIPYANRLVLKPPGDEVDDGEGAQALTPKYAGFLGAMGVAITSLRPAGKAQFGDDFLDVVAEGDYVNPGARVQVIEIEGNRIVVKEV